MGYNCEIFKESKLIEIIGDTELKELTISLDINQLFEKSIKKIRFNFVKLFFQCNPIESTRRIF